MRSGVGRSPSQFYTRCIKDPNLIPLLVTAGVEFGALRVRPLGTCWNISMCRTAGAQLMSATCTSSILLPI